jgi:hypothetical protein
MAHRPTYESLQKKINDELSKLQRQSNKLEQKNLLKK